MLVPIVVIIIGLGLLVWSADLFVEGAAITASHFGMPPLLIGIVVIGFGTSAPEMAVSAISAAQGNSGLALGNAFGSNIANISLILGVTALVSPITVHSQVLRKELPLLCAVTFLTFLLLFDGNLTRLDAIIMLMAFTGLLLWSLRQGMKNKNDHLEVEMKKDLTSRTTSLKKALIWLTVGLVLLLISSRLLVWSAVEIAKGFGVSDLVIGLTIVAVGTSLPEMASSLIAMRKGEDDIALGNIIGSNLFNTLAVIGVAGVINPMKIQAEALNRDFLIMSGLTLLLFAMGFGFGRQGRINRAEATILLAIFIGYTFMLFN